MIFAISLLILLAHSDSGVLYGYEFANDVLLDCRDDGEYVEKISVRSGSDMVKWIDVKCTNQKDWKGGAGAYNEGSLQSDHYPGAMGFCGLSLAYDNNKFRYMCLTNGQDATRCYGDDSYQNDLETVMSCTDDYPGNFRPRLTGMKIWTNSGGNDGFRGAEFYFDQSWECSNVLYVSHDTASQSELVGYYERQGYFRGSTYWKHEDDTLDYCMYYQNWSWRIGSCNLDGSAVIRIDQSDDRIIGYGAYKICPEYFEVSQNWLWYEISSSTKIISMDIVGMDAIPLSWGNSVGYWTSATDGTQSAMSFSKTQSVTSTSTSSHELSETETSAFTSTFASSLTTGYELGVSGEFAGMGVSQQYSFASTLESSASSTVETATTSAVSNSISDSSTQEITCSISSGQFHDKWRLYFWTLYRAAENYPDTGAYVSTCSYVLQTGIECAAHVPPNCPPGYCADDACMTCIDREGIEPLRAVALMYDDYTGCFNQIGLDVRCALSKGIVNGCCTAAEPCGEWEGDCDADFQCEGDLVCYQRNGGMDPCLKADDPLVLAARRNLHQKPGLTRRLLTDASDEDDEFTTSVYLPVHTGCAQFFDEAHCTAGPLYEYCIWDSDNETCVAKDGVTVPDVDATYVYYAPEERNYCGDECQDD